MKRESWVSSFGRRFKSFFFETYIRGDIERWKKRRSFQESFSSSSSIWRRRFLLLLYYPLVKYSLRGGSQPARIENTNEYNLPRAIRPRADFHRPLFPSMRSSRGIRETRPTSLVPLPIFPPPLAVFHRFVKRIYIKSAIFSSTLTV